MLKPISIFYIILLSLLIGVQLLCSFFSKDKSKIWSPLTFIGATLVYYVIVPPFTGMHGYDISNIPNQQLVFLTALIFYVSVLIGFQIKTKPSFRRWNQYFNSSNALRYALVLFLFALVCYVPFRGFRTTVWDTDATIVAERTGFVSYFIDLISVFCASCSLILMSCLDKQAPKKKSWFFFLIVLYLTLVVYIVGGFRIRLVFLLCSLVTVFHLFPRIRRINLILIILIAIPTLQLFSVMDSARSYGRGLNKEAIAEMSYEDVREGAAENGSVLYFSALCTDSYYRTGEREGLDPIINAIFMPIPRAIFPWKPKGEYMVDIQVRTLGTAEGGAAFMNFTEAYASFGMLGVILYGLLMGMLAKLFWDNYQRNKSSMGAILLLALFNGFCYQWISRGYLGGNLNSFLYFVCVPFWLTALFRLFIRK